MRSRAAIIREVGGDWSVEEFELDPPRAGEVLLQMAAAGLCHSDDHIRSGQLAAPKGAVVPGMPPTIGGHEGSAVVLEVGPGVTRFSPRRPRGDVVPGGVREMSLVHSRYGVPVRCRRRHAHPGHAH